MKKYCLLVFLALFLLLTACAPIRQEPSQDQSAPPAEQPAAPSASTDYSVPTFQLDKLPDLPAYAGLPKEIYTRYSSEAYVDTLRLASDYGQLYPYIGKVVNADFFALELRYGLVDNQGRIVVDPVYSGASYITTGPEPGADYLSLSYPIDKIDAAAKETGQQTGYYDMRTHFQFAKADGSWVSPLYYGNNAILSEDRVIVSLQSDNPDYRYSNEGDKYQLYDLESNLIAEGIGSLSGFSEGLSLLTIPKTENGSYYTDCSYIDQDGHTVIAGPFSSATDFKDGKALVTLENGALFAVIDKQGNYLVEPKQLGDSFYVYDSDYLTFWNNGLEGMIDRMGNTVLPAIYNYIYYDVLLGGYAAAQKPDGTYEAVDLQTGRAVPVDGDYTDVFTSGDGWLIAQKSDMNSQIYSPPDVSLIRGDKQYQFPGSEYGDLYLSYIANDIFAVNVYSDPVDGKSSVSFFDAATGETVKVWPGWNYSDSEQTPQGPVHYIYNYDSSYSQKTMALSDDFESIFPKEALAGIAAFNQISYLKDGLFSVRTDRYGGLIRADGSWLIRVVAQEQD